MRRHDILYEWPITEIRRLADSSVAEEFSEQLGDSQLLSFIKLTEEMRGLGADLARAKADREHFNDWSDMRKCIDLFEQEFEAFPGAAFSKFRLSTLFAENLAQNLIDLDENDINENLFEIRELPDSLPLSWFYHENSHSFQDSVAVFSCADSSNLEKDVAASTMSPHFIFHLLAVLHSLSDVPNGHAVLVKKEEPQVAIAAVNAFTRLMILATGKLVHSPRHYKNSLNVIDINGIKAGKLYHQWNDVLDVLSEYNSRDEVLLKYLTIYHVIENLMFKLPIVELERQHGGRLFSIRDFRMMYREVEMKEMVALKRLFKKILDMDAQSGTTFEQHIVTRWQGLVATTSVNEIEKALGVLGIKKGQHVLKHSEFRTGSECAGYFSQMVYAFRCAIVHNKETEFHLTHVSLDENLSVLLESFLMPSLEELCFALIGSPNQEVWYTNKELLLY